MVRVLSSFKLDSTALCNVGLILGLKICNDFNYISSKVNRVLNVCRQDVTVFLGVFWKPIILSL